MMTDDNESWNIRDRHMVEALEYIHNFYGPSSKDIVWEHNTHVGDARATDMASEGMVNVGQLVRKKYGENQVFIIGFGSNQGTVIAANRWGSPAEVMNVPQGEKGSWEDLLHSAKPNIHYLLFTEENKSLFNTEIWHRAIGVVYNPEYEHLGNYVPSLISKRYNAFVYVDVTQALTLLKL